MKNKRKIINKFLSIFEVIEIGKDRIYCNEFKAKYGWNAKSDTYFAIDPWEKSQKFTLKQFHFYVKRLNKIKAFW